MYILSAVSHNTMNSIAMLLSIDVGVSISQHENSNTYTMPAVEHLSIERINPNSQDSQILE